MISEAASGSGDRPALIDWSTGQTVTYATLTSRVERVVVGLAARGFEFGDVLALWAPNLPQWSGVALGAMAAGGAVSGINPSHTERELKWQLTDSGASVLVTVPSLVPAALSAAASSGVREVIALGEAKGATSIRDLISGDSPAPEVALDPETAVALLPYSSGMTGLPKGVMLTHANLVASARQLRRMLHVSGRATTLAVVPFFHIMGFMVNLALPLASGATVVTMPRFDLERFLALIQRNRATFLVVPPIVAALVHHPLQEAYDLSSVELIVSGGAPLGADLQRAVAKRFPTAAVGQGWGMTETTVGATGPDRELGSVPGSVGRVMPSTEVRAVDPETGRDLEAGKRGELRVRGPQVMAGYLGRPDRRPRLRRRGRQRVHRRPAQGAHKGKRLPGGARGARGAAHHAPGRRRRRRHRAPRRAARRGPGRGGGPPRRGRGRRPHRLGGQARRAPQAHPGGPVRRGHPQDSIGQGPPPDTRRTGPAEYRGHLVVRSSSLEISMLFFMERATGHESA